MVQEELSEIFRKAQEEFAHGNYDIAKKLAAKVRGRLDELDINSSNDNIFRVRTLLLSSQILWKQGHYKEALVLTSDAFKSVECLDNGVPEKNVLLAKCHNMNGLSHWALTNYFEAINNYAATLDICENIGERMGIAIATGNIGIIYSDLGNNDLARKYYAQALALHKELGNEHEIAEITCNTGVTFHRNRDYLPSLPYFLESLEIFERLDNRTEASRLRVNIGNYYLHLEEYDKALDYFTTALAVYEDHNMQVDISVVKGLLGILHATKDFSGYSPQKAKSYLLESIAMDEKTGARLELIENYKLLSKTYRNEGDWRESARYFEIFFNLEIKTRTRDTAKMVQRFALEREAAVMQREKEILKIKNDELGELNEQLNNKNKRLKEMDEEKNDFLSIVSHGLKDPLNAITMVAQVLANEAGILAPSEIKEFAEDIRYSSGRMFKLITELLDINKIESGLAITDSQIIYADNILRVVAEHHHEAARVKCITISEQLIIPAQVHSSPSAIMQILDNLISNAVNYSFPNTEIVLKTEIVGGRVLISVADQGPGLNDQDKHNIFGKFKRLSARPTGGEHSGGLGLFVVKKLVEAIGGSIRYESELGKGTTFTVDLPVCSKDNEN